MKFVRPDRLEMEVSILRDGNLRFVYREYVSEETKAMMNQGTQERVRRNTKVIIEHLTSFAQESKLVSKAQYIDDDDGMSGLIVEATREFIMKAFPVIATREVANLGKGIEEDPGMERRMNLFDMKFDDDGNLEVVK